MPERISDCFSDDYATARRRFLDTAGTMGADLYELPLTSRAPDNGPLSIDIAWFGSSTPARAVIHSCGLHGVEGFAGSAIQLAIMNRDIQIPSDGAVIFVHALNPYGMAWLRRFNENNVDLNRNFGVTEGGRPITSQAYRRLNAFLNPTSPPRTDAFYVRAAYYILRYGLKPIKQAIAEGQYEFPKGLFYGGMLIEEGPSLYQSWIAKRFQSLECGFSIDVHTGLGKSAQESLFLHKAPSNYKEMEQQIGRKLLPDPTEEGVGYDIFGAYANCFDVLPEQAQMYAVTQEFGTHPSPLMLHALREENRWHHYGDGNITHPTKLRLKEVFAPESNEWREKIVNYGVSLANAVVGYVFD